MKGSGEKRKTSIREENNVLDMGTFELGVPETCTYVLKNEGANPFFIYEIWAGCSCLKTEFSKKPVSPGDSAFIFITHNAETRGVFNKQINIYCNTEEDIIQIQIMGFVK